MPASKKHQKHKVHTKSAGLLPRVRSWPRNNQRQAAVVFAVLVLCGFGLWIAQGRAATTAKGDVNTSTVEQRLLNDPNVLWVGTADSSGSWKIPFGVAGEGQPQNLTQMVPPSAWRGKALRLRHPGPNHPDSGDGRWGYDARNTFVKMGIPEQTEAYLRYYIWVPSNLAKQGKLPGLQANSGNIWGPNNGKADGYDDWGTRTMWKQVGTNSNKIGMITYLNLPYAGGAPMPDGYSISKRYMENGTEQLLNKGAWNYVEQRVKINTPGQRNGIFEGWINGKKGISLNDVEYRKSNELLINQWNFLAFWGGPPTDYPTSQTDFYFDDFVISKSYIGPRVDSGGTPPPSPQNNVDLVVTNISHTPVNPKAGDAVTFSATIKNIGSTATPANTIHGVAFSVNGTKMTWSDSSTDSLAPGATRTVTANGGSDSTPGDGSWIADVAGNISVEAYVDDIDRISGEVDESNNALTTVIIVGDVMILPGDVDGNGAVNGLDLSRVLSNYNKTDASRSDGDVDGDGIVNGLDLSAVLTNYGS